MAILGAFHDFLGRFSIIVSLFHSLSLQRPRDLAARRSGLELLRRNLDPATAALLLPSAFAKKKGQRRQSDVEVGGAAAWREAGKNAADS